MTILGYTINLPTLATILVMIFLLWRLSVLHRLNSDKVTSIILDDPDSPPVDWKKVKPGKNTITIEGKPHMIVAKDARTKTVWYLKEPAKKEV